MLVIRCSQVQVLLSKCVQGMLVIRAVRCLLDESKGGGKRAILCGTRDEREMVRGALEANSFQN